LLGRKVSATELRKIEEGSPGAIYPQATDGADAQAGFTHLSAVEDVAGFAVLETFQQVAVGLALNVARGVGRKGATGNVSPASRRTHLV
jgi:hypothetical protein